MTLMSSQYRKQALFKLLTIYVISFQTSSAIVLEIKVELRSADITTLLLPPPLITGSFESVLDLFVFSRAAPDLKHTSKTALKRQETHIVVSWICLPVIALLMFSSTLFASTGSSLLGLWKSKSPQISNNNINNNNNNNNKSNNTGYISTNRHLNKVIAVSNADSDDTDDFIHIDIKKLSYAEVAAFNDTNHYSSNPAAGNGQEDLCVINSRDLESTVSDYQMTNAMARNTKRAKTAKEAVIQEDIVQEDLTLTDSVVHDTHFNDKDTKRKKKMKKMKAKK